MDQSVLRGIARWPDVPAVYGWLALDRRGNWLLKDPGSGGFGRIGNAALRDFIGRNYAADARGCWYFQNGPQRVYVRLAYTPLVVRHDGVALVDHCGRPVRPAAQFLDDEGSVLILGQHGIGLLDDRDLARFADTAEALPRVAREEVATRFGFVPDPAFSLR
ncbi:MAG TPA: DUF2946 family protein [Burkholderiales bacterium]|nr:DUF2946 family protein [Burkholderiales bacterium]